MQCHGNDFKSMSASWSNSTPPSAAQNSWNIRRLNFNCLFVFSRSLSCSKYPSSVSLSSSNIIPLAWAILIETRLWQTRTVHRLCTYVYACTYAVPAPGVARYLQPRTQIFNYRAPRRRLLRAKTDIPSVTHCYFARTQNINHALGLWGVKRSAKPKSTIT